MHGEKLCASIDIPEGEVVILYYDDKSLAVSKIDGEITAIDNICSHDNGPLGEGKIVRGNIICPRHGAAFDPKTGRALTLPAVKSVCSYKLYVDDGDVYLAQAE
jgi:3-phenylpropionate/trans-cinnamate dioxygenase ferredoxin subunit